MEYGLILGLVGVVAVTSLVFLTDAASSKYQSTASGPGVAVGDDVVAAYANLDSVDVGQGVLTLGYPDVSAIIHQPIPSVSPSFSGGVGTMTFSIRPALPSGLTMSTTTGAITGTPTVKGLTDHTVTVTDQLGTTTQDAFTVTVAGLSVSYANISATRGVAIATQSPTVSGSSGTKTFSISPPLPTGLTMSTTTGAITGTPTVALAASPRTVTLTDTGGGGSSTTTTLNVTVRGISFTTGYSTVSATRGTAISSQTPVTVADASVTAAFTVNPSLPSGLSINSSDGKLSGTPDGAASSRSYTVTVTDDRSYTAQTSVTITVVGLKISNYANITSQPVNAPAPTVTGFVGAKAFSISPALPAGLLLNTTTGAITGTTATKVNKKFTVTVTDAGTAGNTATTAQFTIKLN